MGAFFPDKAASQERPRLRNPYPPAPGELSGGLRCGIKN